MTEKEKEAHRIANNAIYFDDSADYGSALWEIISLFDDDAEYASDLDYIEKKPE